MFSNRRSLSIPVTVFFPLPSNTISLALGFVNVVGGVVCYTNELTQSRYSISNNDSITCCKTDIPLLYIQFDFIVWQRIYIWLAVGELNNSGDNETKPNWINGWNWNNSPKKKKDGITEIQFVYSVAFVMWSDAKWLPLTHDYNATNNHMLAKPCICAITVQLSTKQTTKQKKCSIINRWILLKNV